MVKSNAQVSVGSMVCPTRSDGMSARVMLPPSEGTTAWLASALAIRPSDSPAACKSSDREVETATADSSSSGVGAT